jgi:putative alpha-1,2-mannosidase
MRLGLVLAAIAAMSAAPALAQDKSAYEAVDPFIGTGGDGHTFPGAVAPFGMVQLSPDTDILPFKQSYARAAGYRYSDPTILGFSHTHFSGSGHSDLATSCWPRSAARPSWSRARPTSRARATARASATTARWPSPATTP